MKRNSLDKHTVLSLLTAGESLSGIARKLGISRKPIARFLRSVGKYPDKSIQLGDISNQRFGRLIAMWPCGYRGKTPRIHWRCACDCGRYCIAPGYGLPSQKNISCGCARTKHGHTERRTRRSKEYQSWCDMLKRCYNPSMKKYSDYGGRGITVCDRWNPATDGSFVNFLQDMGLKPTPKHTIERRYNNGNYHPLNCYWATYKEQANNRRAPQPTARTRKAYENRERILELIDAGISATIISKQYGVHHGTIELIIKKTRVAKCVVVDGVVHD